MRLRLINTDSDPHRFALAGTPFRVSALDGRDLNGPDEVADVGLRLAAGGRHDLVFDMPANPVVLLLDDAVGDGVLLRPDDAAGEPDTPDTSAGPSRAATLKHLRRDPVQGGGICVIVAEPRKRGDNAACRC